MEVVGRTIAGADTSTVFFAACTIAELETIASRPSAIPLVNVLLLVISFDPTCSREITLVGNLVRPLFLTDLLL